MKIATTIQARMTSTRLPGKVLMPVIGKPLLEYMIERLRRMKTSHEIIVACTTNTDDDPIETLCHNLGVGLFRGSEEDVLERVVLAAQKYHVDLIVETTGDCPLIDPVICDQVVQKFLAGKYDYVSNVLVRSFPRGMDTQVFSTSLLEKVHQTTQDPVDREHVSYYIYQHPEKYRLGNIEAPAAQNLPDLRLTVDTPEDFALIKRLITDLYPKKPDFSLTDILDHMKKNPELFEINQHIEQKKVTYDEVRS